MKEALSVITSAWSLAFILIFARVISSLAGRPSDHGPVEVYPFLFLFWGSVTGSGWLWYRASVKGGRRRRHRMEEKKYTPENEGGGPIEP